MTGSEMCALSPMRFRVFIYLNQKWKDLSGLFVPRLIHMALSLPPENIKSLVPIQSKRQSRFLQIEGYFDLAVKSGFPQGKQWGKDKTTQTHAFQS